MKLSFRKGLILLIGALFFISLDYFIKQYVVAHIPLVRNFSAYPYGGIAVFKDVFGGLDFSINHVVNRGGAWGIFSSFFPFLVVLRATVAVGIFIHLLKFNPILQRQIPLSIIITGAVANLIDCFAYGHVVDMFHFNLWGYHFPLFNIADSLIFVGVVALLCQMLLFDRKRIA